MALRLLLQWMSEQAKAVQSISSTTLPAFQSTKEIYTNRFKYDRSRLRYTEYALHSQIFPVNTLKGMGVEANESDMNIVKSQHKLHNPQMDVDKIHVVSEGGASWKTTVKPKTTDVNVRMYSTYRKPEIDNDNTEINIKKMNAGKGGNLNFKSDNSIANNSEHKSRMFSTCNTPAMNIASERADNEINEQPQPAASTPYQLQTPNKPTKLAISVDKLKALPKLRPQEVIKRKMQEFNFFKRFSMPAIQQAKQEGVEANDNDSANKRNILPKLANLNMSFNTPKQFKNWSFKRVNLQTAKDYFPSIFKEKSTKSLK